MNHIVNSVNSFNVFLLLRGVLFVRQLDFVTHKSRAHADQWRLTLFGVFILAKKIGSIGVTLLPNPLVVRTVEP